MTTRPLQPSDYVTPAVRLIRPLAEGGMGRVWLAQHEGLNAEVVVKVMAEEMALRPDGAQRFAREAAACAAIKSPHVVQVFDHGLTADGIPYIVMELLEGKDLGAYLAENGRMDPHQAVALVVQMGKALSKAHRAGIVHRDIKPENIFLCDTEGHEVFVKLLDFGTAKCTGLGPLTRPDWSEDPGGTHATAPGQIMGTPYYMSPEQSVGGEIDERSDIWSLGVVVFEALTGRKPFDGPSVGAITIAIHGVLPKMTAIAPELPAALDDWFAQACAQLPQDRFFTLRDATNAFVEAVTGAAPIEATESVCFPAVSYPPKSSSKPSSKRDSTPVSPEGRPIEPLVASLPERGSERRPTTIAAGLVMATAAAAMIAIVLHRSPAPVEAPAETPAAQAASPPPPPPPPSPPAPEPAPETESPAPAAKAAALTTGGRRAVTAPTPVAAPTREAHAKPAKRPRGAPPGATPPGATPPGATSKETTKQAAKEASRDDEDLVRLTKAASQHATEAEPSSPPPAAAPAPPAPSPAPSSPGEGAPPPSPPPLPQPEPVTP